MFLTQDGGPNELLLLCKRVVIDVWPFRNWECSRPKRPCNTSKGGGIQIIFIWKRSLVQQEAHFFSYVLSKHVLTRGNPKAICLFLN